MLELYRTIYNLFGMYELMVLKNLILFVSGFILGILFISLFIAYQLLTAERVQTDDKFVIAELQGSVIWNKPKSFIDALEGFYAMIFFHFMPEKWKKNRLIRRKRSRGKKILISVLIGIVVIISGGLWWSFSLQFQVNDSLVKMQDLIHEENIKELEELDKQYHEWIHEKKFEQHIKK